MNHAGPSWATDEILELRGHAAQSTSFSAALDAARARVDLLGSTPPEVPSPRDPGGGYTHERHKANGIVIAEAGWLYQWTGEAPYADLARQLLLAYARMYRNSVPIRNPARTRRGGCSGRA